MKMAVALLESEYEHMIQGDPDEYQQFLDALDTSYLNGSYCCIYVHTDDFTGVIGYNKDQFLSACEALETPERELLGDFLAEKYNRIDDETITVRFLEVGYGDI